MWLRPETFDANTVCSTDSPAETVKGLVRKLLFNVGVVGQGYPEDDLPDSSQLIKEEAGPWAGPAGRAGSCGGLGAGAPTAPGGLIVVYDGGVLTAKDIEAIVVQDGELANFAFACPEQVARRVTPVVARRVAACLEALKNGTVASLEDGSPAD